MNLGLRRDDIRKLPTDQLAVVLYLRLLFINLPLTGIVAIAMLELVDRLWSDALDGRRGMFLLTATLVLYLSWTFYILFVVRMELRQREHQELTHTPTFYSLAKATHCMAAFSLLRPLFGTWVTSYPFEVVSSFAWVISVFMAGFYLVYFVLLLLVWKRPPLSIAVAFLLAIAAAMYPPTHGYK